jgi:hypothetical protein
MLKYMDLSLRIKAHIKKILSLKTFVKAFGSVAKFLHARFDRTSSEPTWLLLLSTDMFSIRKT